MTEEDMFEIKKILGAALEPANTALIIAFGGLILRGLFRKKTVGTLLIGMAGAWLVIASLPLTGRTLVKSLESLDGSHAYSVGQVADDIASVVVIGNVFEGVRLWKQSPKCRLVLSSGEAAVRMCSVARDLGVPAECIVLETRARTTEEQAAALKPLLLGERFILTTWALHMPRALRVFRCAGLDPIPAASDFLRVELSSLDSLRPRRMALEWTRLALHEYGGLGWTWLVCRWEPRLGHDLRADSSEGSTTCMCSDNERSSHEVCRNRR
jgi:uncharacterized SAM-binding protein YcdF (DUF218 family)